MKYIFSIGCFALLFAGCIDDLNLNPSTEFTYKGHWAAPIVNTRLNLENLVANQELATADDDGLVHIIYREDSVYQHFAYDYTTVPAQDPVMTSFTVGMPPLAVGANLGTFGGAKMKTLTVESGRLFWSVDNPVEDTVELALTLQNTINNGQPAVFSIRALGFGVTNGIIDIDNLTMDLTQGSPAYNNLGFLLEIVESGNAPIGTQLPITLAYQDLIIGGAVGFFGERVILFPSGSVKTNLGLLQNISDGLYLADPRIHIFVNSNVGLPLQISPNLIAIGRNGKFVDLGLSPLQFTGSTILGDFVNDTISISTANSNLDDFIAAVPQEIIYSGHVTMNPSGELPIDNFITSDGAVHIGFEIDMPMELRTKDLTIQNTIYDIDFGINESEIEFVEELSLGFQVENGFPLSADLDIYFQDSMGVILDSTSIAMFDAATVDINGNVAIPSKSKRYLSFTNEQIQNILLSDDIRVKVVVNTSNNGNQAVRLLTNYYIDLVIGARVKFNYEL